ncbi:hypothetical protein HYPSUDRAFT_207077 [Hypholoma sublateritium FD-334 SS-4]|uniref:Uncharacterized protein n=1 Tax=Hypholoma sublateritium (strain FD-334 SS-4) TaxID=945553 RepID=A0A0D2KP27_HYPSF|nr:hypothetical protein HYPSUDRAFT_207077 [Hypholoma sublateritium FD-334 SS-4]
MSGGVGLGLGVSAPRSASRARASCAPGLVLPGSAHGAPLQTACRIPTFAVHEACSIYPPPCARRDPQACVSAARCGAHSHTQTHLAAAPPCAPGVIAAPAINAEPTGAGRGGAFPACGRVDADRAQANAAMPQVEAPPPTKKCTLGCVSR